MYKINEIFYSIQGEGINAGVPAVFIRFSGCNLSCPFCDTEHGEGNMMTADDIVAEVKKYPARLAVVTGGEPSLFIDDRLVDALHAIGCIIAIETNGTCRLPSGIDHVTLSPKDAFCDGAQPVIDSCDELKVVYCGSNDPSRYDGIKARVRVLQPCDTGDAIRNAELTAAALDYCLKYPMWRLSLQLHKLLDVR
ncbi:MAG TPA: 7-carboxy-7-deazaguanine synthase QueE [Muribaculum sp.]|jgi:organic radical activating enzyme|uniref:7-carboxy-7-deazaguanine synthase n=1 Tax=Heminiphilus faecis TaxID=2601703 RepID=A0ABV4CS84_9BACT|nr:7-carboxy-7-deazaguanine synthase QueE [Heminiphilus faecis]RLT76957.1 radical SAM protein [bacterium J10(2018)]HRF67791.1 7-carboxy-7-deazaguanine synthase QueE [Muribaculum sp.]